MRKWRVNIAENVFQDCGVQHARHAFFLMRRKPLLEAVESPIMKNRKISRQSPPTASNILKIIFIRRMQIIVRPFLIDELKKISALAHGVSPRCFETETGEKGTLCLGPNRDLGSSALHRKSFLRSLDVESDEVYLVKQVHGDRVYVLDNATLSCDDIAAVEADAIVTGLPGKPVGVLTADCVPVIVYDACLHVAGVVHAGRKGTAENILSKTIGVLRSVFGSRPENILVAMGPGIGGCCYEVDEICVRPFKDKFRTWADFAKKTVGDKYRLDLFLASEEDGLNAGIRPGNIFRLKECTACRVDRIFSYRKEGKTGRLLTLAMLRQR